jgi:hypothetical protein
MEATVTTFDLFAAGYSSPPPPGVAAGKPDKHVSGAIMPNKLSMAYIVQVRSTAS